jgi:hypothetical protein
MITRPVVYDPQGLMRNAFNGDIVTTNEIVPALNATAGVTLTGALLGLTLYMSSGAGAVTLTLDTAANIIASLAPQFGYNQNASAPAGTANYAAIQPGTAWRFKVVATTANAVTIVSTANTGTVVNRGVTAASTSRDFLVTINNGTPAQSITVNSTNASNQLTGMSQSQLSTLSVGMIVTNAVLGLQGATIIGINIAAGSLTMSTTANATAVGTVVNFSPLVTIDGL